MRKAAFFFVNSIFIILNLQGQPIFLLKDTNIVTCSGIFMDEGSYSTGYNGGTKKITFKSADNRPLGLLIDSLRFSEFDVMTVFDGPTTESPILSVLTNVGGLRGIKSTGTALTVQFYASGSGMVGKFGWSAKISCLTNPSEAKFATVTNKIGDGNIDLADYDNDGDQDILQGGVIYRNDTYRDSIYYFEKIYSPLGYWKNTSVTSSDFDGDGDKDLFIMGESSHLGYSIIPKLYLNDGTGKFTVSAQQFAGAFLGQCKPVDFNNDGKMDISYIGKAGNNITTFRLYMNIGNGLFTEKITDVPGLEKSSLDWADYDHDGDKDLVIHGDNFSATSSKFFINDNQTLTSININLKNTNTGQIGWFDINNDSKPDIINTGIQTVGFLDAIKPQILINNYPNGFTEFQNDLPALFQAHFDVADYDNDNYPDILLNGNLPTVGGGSQSAIFKNTNNTGFFKKITIPANSGINSVYWKDINKDGKPDAFITSNYNESSFLLNKGNDIFTPCSLPLPSVESEGEVQIDDFDGNGVFDMVFAGLINDLDCFGGANSIIIKGIGWNSIPLIKFTKAVDIIAQTGSVGFGNTFWRWGDLDNDKLFDILVTSDPGDYYGNTNPIKIFKNNNNDNFSLIYNGHPGQNFIYQAKLIDLDNDKKNELFIAPNGVFKWNNGEFITLSENSAECPYYYSCVDQYLDFADYNKDGFLDCTTSISGGVKILKNDKNGKLNEILFIPGFNAKFLKWVDLDNDNDLDIIGSRGYAIENIGNDAFATKPTLLPVSCGIAAGDYNKDSFIDIFSLPTRDIIGQSQLHYNQNGSFFFIDKTPAIFPDVRNGSYNAGTFAYDFDNDGDMDIAYSSGNCRYNGILMNYYNLLNPTIHLRNPNNSEVLNIGTSYKIEWTGNSIGPFINLYLSTDSGVTFNLIEANIISDKMSGSYNWVIQGISPSKNCLLKITDSNNGLLDISNKIFTIASITSATTIKQSSEIKIFPNPVKGNLNLLSLNNDLGIVQVIIYNSLGIKIKELKISQMLKNNLNLSISVSDLPSGVYYIKTIGKKNTITKFIKL